MTEKIAFSESLAGILAPAKTEAAYSGTLCETWTAAGSQHFSSNSPINTNSIGNIATSRSTDYENVISCSTKRYQQWRKVPAPKRGDIIRDLGEELRKYKAELAEIITLEMGKISQEALGEVQEAIDIADFAVGLSRQLYGRTMHSERPEHRMYEQWHPLGPVAVISAFNFPMAVWAWNACIAAICGNTIIWKPSELTPLCAIAITELCDRVMRRHDQQGLFTLLVDNDASIGKKLSEDARVPLVSATGSTRMGRSVAQTVAKRFGRSLLELGGNNAMIVCADADLKLSMRAILFGAVYRRTTLHDALGLFSN
ncbi:UNVERIFIED_CONTAM: hypothetical protein GTU68_031404 [Idotea baltica]|nr:hypothetical protein [Idotea baltica]